jgi:predicted GNAT superfamily acetyltransferase
VGIRDKAVAFRSLDNLWFYSQYTGVRPEAEGHGLGVAIKEFQREVLRDVFGIFTVVCTYDPLTAVNAHRNIRRFGMSVLEYRAATYGDYGGRLNRLDVPTDRFFMSWDLKKDLDRPDPARPSREDAEIPCVLATSRRTVSGKTRSLELEIAGGLDLGRAAGSARVPVPADFYEMLRETDVADPGVRSIPVDWRMKTREAFQELFARGFRIVDFRPEALPHAGPHYLLERG